MATRSFATRSALFALITAFGVFQGASIANSAVLTWYLSTDIPLSDGGTLNGFFSIDSVSGFTNGHPFDLFTAGGSPAFNEEYAATINASNPNSLTVDFFAPNPAYSSSLTLVFQNSLLVASADNPIVGGDPGPSFECEGYSCTLQDTRYVLTGSASAAPLPAALPLFASGCGVIGLLLARRKNRKTPAIA